MALLREAGEQDVDELGDLTTPLERRLGALVAERHGVDLYFLDRFPAKVCSPSHRVRPGARFVRQGPLCVCVCQVRPFYTMRCPDDARLSNSYDVFLRGEEICSGLPP